MNCTSCGKVMKASRAFEPYFRVREPVRHLPSYQTNSLTPYSFVPLLNINNFVDINKLELFKVPSIIEKNSDQPVTAFTGVFSTLVNSLAPLLLLALSYLFTIFKFWSITFEHVTNTISFVHVRILFFHFPDLSHQIAFSLFRY